MSRRTRKQETKARAPDRRAERVWIAPLVVGLAALALYLPTTRFAYLNWDDEINGTGYNQGYGFPAYSQTDYTNSGLARYRRNTGYVGTPSATDSAYSDYRRRFKNELMARSQAEIQSIKTNP